MSADTLSARPRPFRYRGALLPLALFALLAAVPFVAGALGQPFYVSLFTRIMIFAVAALALDLVLGYGGMVSLGHAAYMGVGAYAVGILSFHGVDSGWVQWPLGIGAAALAALVIGALSLRTRGVYFIMITLAFAQMLYYTANALSTYGGDDGMTLWSRSTFSGLLKLSDARTFYWVVFAALALSYLGLRRVVASKFGRVLRGCKENERRMTAIGYNTTLYKLAAFVLSGALAGLSGVLLANHTEFVSPAYMSWVRSGDLIVMVVIGGLGTLHGPIVGTVLVLVLEEVLSKLTQHWWLIFGPLIVLTVWRAKGGVVRLFGGRA
ncbi:branched-chain amino acid ABC transporter permease [Azospirillum sp.]|uniref:branched-chain amino acid ABC transporter permease n=1 Tax=Azospirillum sp. TaxID=34012 RepID=UPI003D753EFF